MSGKADSKQMSGPIVSGAPSGSVTRRMCAPSPGTMFTGAALLILVSQDSAARNGMYSPNGTSRVFVYVPAIPVGPDEHGDLALLPVSARVLVDEDLA